MADTNIQINLDGSTEERKTVLPLNAQIEKKYLYYDKNKAGIIYLCSDQTQ